MQMNKIGIIYSSVDGHTKKISEHIKGLIEEHKIPVDLFSISDFHGQIGDYKTLIIGSSIRYGIHGKVITKFIIDNKETLSSINTAFFSVNLVARKQEKNQPETNPYMQKFIKSIDWTADIMDVFAGKLDYSIYSFFDKLMIRLIMKMTHGPTKTDGPIEYTDWDRVKLFAEKVVTSHKALDS